ncbi:PMCA-type calcium-translocating P-type ATPase [Dichotomocladium elegans]|nr:PMCA-type calcium-translocating P-type ATPase [Dichotomocladium elegans]
MSDLNNNKSESSSHHGNASPAHDGADTQSQGLSTLALPTATATSSSSSHVGVDMSNEYLQPHSDPSNPFAFTPTQLSALMDPKNLELLRQFGGLQGVAKGLHANTSRGLTPHEKIGSTITLNDLSSLAEDETEDPAQKTPLRSQTMFSSATHTSAESSKGTFPQRVAVFGANVLPRAESKNIFQLMWMAMKDKTLILLTAAAVISLAVGLYEDIGMPKYDAQGNRIPGVEWVEGVAIIVAVLIVVLVGSVNDFQKERQFRKLNAKKEDRELKATREGMVCMISIHDIQVGDILHLEPGDIVAADGIFIEGHNLKCDESAATGESDAVRKQSWKICQPPNAEKRSQPDPFILSGSKIVEGVGTYLVTGVGIHSYHGRTMMSLRSEAESTPLQEKLNRLASMIAKLGSAAGLLMLVVLLIRYFVNWRYGIPTVATQIVMELMKILIVVVTIVVVAVPEGLPLAVTLALAYATSRMIKDNNLVRVLAACETMGNATTICSDKTGTLTQNRMTVVAGVLGMSYRFKHAPEDNSKSINIEELTTAVPEKLLQLLNESVAVNTTAFEAADDNGQESFVGNKTETALLSFTRDHTGAENLGSLRAANPVEQAFPFSSERKSMTTVVRVVRDNATFWRAHVKGASEILLERCTMYQTEQQGPQPIREGDRRKLEELIQHYASQSLRTIGIAYREFDEWPYQGQEEVPYDEVATGLTLLAIVGIEDPLRPGVKEAVQACRSAGVFVRMVTGDNVTTAKSIAKQCGIYTTGGLVMEGPVFRNLPPHELDAILPRLQVLARSSPQDKRILVSRLRDLGDIVAVTGDGTNDGPALKAADVGFSMGIAGTEVAKEASSIILMDDNFSSIVKAIAWGRCVNDAVKKFLQFQITVNITAVILTFMSSVISSSQKSVLTAVQLLWVNLIMDTFAALALATDPPSPELLERAPEPRSSPLITFKMWKMIIGQSIFQIIVTCVLLYSSILNLPTESDTLQTVVFNTFVFCQIFNEINCRRIDSHLNIFKRLWHNKFFIFIFFLCIGGQAIIVNFGGSAFQVTSINGVHWAISIVVGLLAIPIGAIIRLLPDRLFAFILIRKSTRDRYLGNTDNANRISKIPSMYMAGGSRWSTSSRTKPCHGDGIEIQMLPTVIVDTQHIDASKHDIPSEQQKQ